MINSHPKCITPKRQKGVVSLLISLAILALIIAGALVMLLLSFSSQKEAAIQRRANQAFDAAQSGLAVATSYTNENRDTVIDDSDGDGDINYVFGPYTMSNGATYTVTISNPTNGNFDRLELISEGKSDDTSITRTVQNQIYYDTFEIIAPPPVPLMARGNVALQGNVSIGNTRASNTATDITIWAGGSVSLKGSADTYTSSGKSSDKNTTGSDIIQNDSQLSSISSADFFDTFFGKTRAEVKSMATTSLTSTGSNNYSSDVAGLTNQIIWIEQNTGTATINGNGQIGTPTEPVTLIISGSGDFKLNGGVTIYGTVYVDFDWNNNGGGSVEIHGGAFANGDIDINGVPETTYVDYSNILAGEPDTKTYSQIPGSWRDF